jgi:hypothetical protein
MNTQADTQHSHSDDCCKPAHLLDEQSAHRLLTVVTIGGLALGTFGTFHAATSLFFGAEPSGRAFVSARLEAVHHLALVTIVTSQILQLIGSVALWRRRLLGRTLLLAYAAVYLAALITVESMRAIDQASTYAPASSAQHAILALSQMHLVVYGSLFPLFLATILTRPWIVRLLGRKGEPLPVPPPGAYRAPVAAQPEEQRAAA